MLAHNTAIPSPRNLRYNGKRRDFVEGTSLTMTVRDVYMGGVLRPAEPLALAEGETVEITIAAAGTIAPLSEEDTVRRIQACKTYKEWLEVTKLLPPDDGGCDIVKALDDNRLWSGERHLLPDQGSII
jgi:predicted DNA-binding antitoxin AbrB/MazE fold protein